MLGVLGRALSRYFKVGNPEWTVRRRLVILTTAFAFWQIEKATTVIAAAKTVAADRMVTVVDQMVILLLGTLGAYIVGNVADARVKDWLDKRPSASPQGQGD